MVGLNGIGSAPEPANTTQPGARGTREAARTVLERDGVKLSTEAKDMSEAVRLANTHPTSAEIRAEQIAQARHRLEQGAHRIQSFVRVVAARMSGYL
jgi:hypothetical protein